MGGIDNTANSAQLDLELGLSLAIKMGKYTKVKFIKLIVTGFIHVGTSD